MVSPRNAELGLGTPGEPVTVRGMIHHATRTVQFRTNLRVTSVVMRPTGHSTLMTFRVGDRNPVRLFTEA